MHGQKQALEEADAKASQAREVAAGLRDATDIFYGTDRPTGSAQTDTLLRDGQRLTVPQSDVGRDHFWNQQIAAQSRGE